MAHAATQVVTEKDKEGCDEFVGRMANRFKNKRRIKNSSSIEIEKEKKKAMKKKRKVRKARLKLKKSSIKEMGIETDDDGSEVDS